MLKSKASVKSSVTLVGGVERRVRGHIYIVNFRSGFAFAQLLFILYLVAVPISQSWCRYQEGRQIISLILLLLPKGHECGLIIRSGTFMDDLWFALV